MASEKVERRYAKSAKKPADEPVAPAAAGSANPGEVPLGERHATERKAMLDLQSTEMKDMHKRHLAAMADMGKRHVGELNPGPAEGKKG